MAAPAGGFADKVGNRYEAHYLVEAALELLDGQRQTVQWEGVGEAFDGVEYRSRLADGSTECVQCKSNRDKHWTIPALSEEGVLGAIYTQLSRKSADCFTLILAGSASAFHGLIERAVASATFDEFLQALSQSLERAFAKLCTTWELSDSASDREAARQLLTRCRVIEHATTESIERSTERRCADLFLGPPGASRAAIRDILEENLGRNITSDWLLSTLRSDRFNVTLRDWGRLPDRVEAVQALRQRFRKQLGRLLIRGKLVHRAAETAAVLSAIADAGHSKVILLHGGAGNGKSGVLYELVGTLEESGICVIPIRLDNALPSGHLLKYSREVLQLPDTPVRCARRLSPGKRSVIVIDQLDAVRWAGVHSTSAWDVTLELLEEALRHPDVSVVIACRSFDIRDDPNLRKWRREELTAGRIQEIEIPPFDAATVARVLGATAASPLTTRQVSLLCNPLMLSIWCDLSDRGVDLQGIAGPSQLLSEHWKSVKRRINDRHAISDDAAEQVISDIRGWAEKHGRLDFPSSLVSNEAVLEALASESYLDRLDQSRFRVAHQRYLDHQVALAVTRDVLKAHVTVTTWLRNTEQSLMRREQVRHVLALLRDGDPPTYAQVLEDLLIEDGVREHIRDLVLRLLAESAPPLPAEVQLVFLLARDGAWARRVRHRTLTSLVWWQLLVEAGILQGWLTAERQEDWKWAAWACSRLAEHDANAVSDLLVRLVNEGRLSASRLARCVPFDSQYDTRQMASWRFQAQRRSEMRCDLYEIEHTAKNNPSAALRFAMHLIRWHLAHMAHPGLMQAEPAAKFERLASDRAGVIGALENVAAALPRDTWVSVSPHLLRHLRRLERRRQSLGKEERRLAWDHPSRSLNRVMRGMLAQAAASLAPTESPWLWQQLQPYLRLRSRTAQRLSAKVIGALAAPVPELAVRWVVQDLRRVGGDGARYDLRSYATARPLVRHLWEAAPNHRCQLVGAIQCFHDPNECENLRYRMDNVRKGYRCAEPNWVGLPQFLLLSALPVELLAPPVRARLAQWDAKFCTSPERLRMARPDGWFLSEPDHWKSKRLHGGLRSMRDLIPAAHLPLVSDQAWIEMASPAWTDRLSRRWKDGSHLSVETPERLVGYAFQQAAKLNPARFVRLAPNLPPDSHDQWFEAVLDAAAIKEPDKNVASAEWQAASAEEIERCLSHLACRDGRHLTMTLARLVHARPNDAWSDTTIDRLCWLAVNHEDPKPGNPAPRSDKPEVSADDLVQTSLNCTRGTAIYAIERLLWNMPEKRSQFVEVAHKAVRDPHPAVRIMAIGLVAPLLKDDAALAIRLLETACGGDDSRVLRSQHLSRVLGYLWWRCDSRVEAIVERMAFSGLAKVEEAGAFFATIIAIRKDRLEPILSRCSVGSLPQRVGVATALSKMAKNTPEDVRAVDRLSTFFDDPDAEVAGAAASVFRHEEVLRSPLGLILAARFVKSAQFFRDPDDLIAPLDRYAGDLVPYQSVLADVITRATTDMSELNADLRRASYGFADRASECILRIYERAQSPSNVATRQWCLDQFDALVATGDSGAERALSRLDAGG